MHKPWLAHYDRDALLLAAHTASPVFTSVEFLAALPRSAVGKPLRRVLREGLQEAEEGAS